MPRVRRISSRSVAQKLPLPGLSMTISRRQRRQVRNDLPAGFAAHQDAAAGAVVADAGTDAAGAPALVRRQVGQVGAVALARMEDVVAARRAAPPARARSGRSARGSATDRSPSCPHSRRRRRNRSACR